MDVGEGPNAGLGLEPDLGVCGEAGDHKGALRVADALAPDLAIVDIALKGHVRDRAAPLRDPGRHAHPPSAPAGRAAR
jgi:hypothetical protein